MQIPETSLIPATIGLLKFFQENGFQSFFQNYPYWYLGEVPYRYLIGPITPLLINSDALINNLIYFIPLFILISSFGWAIFIASFNSQKRAFLFFITLILFIVTPWKYLYGLAIADFSSFFAKSLIPFFLLFLYKEKKVLAIIFLTFMLLISTSVIPSAVVFSLALSVKNWKTRVKSVLYIFSLSIFISSIWYGSNYWIRILMNPSIGGKAGLSVILGVFDFFKLFLPFLVAFVVVKFSGSLKKRLPIFIISSLVSFVIMTLYRFFANPEFWLDWITWFYELEISLCLLITYAIYKNKAKYLMLIFIPIIFLYIFINKLKLESSSQLPLLKELEKISYGERVFLSGSTVFWANSSTKLVQLRGGRDEVSKNSEWLNASYIFRESQNEELIRQNLKNLKIKYVLVHTGFSKEYYHDFKNEMIWATLAIPVYKLDGNIIYKID